MINQFYFEMLVTALMANCPKDTRNMVSHITLEDYGDYWKITISGPKTNKDGSFYDYAKAVNYNQQRTAKEARNYMWIEKTIAQVSKVMGGNIQYELS